MRTRRLGLDKEPAQKAMGDLAELTRDEIQRADGGPIERYDAIAEEIWKLWSRYRALSRFCSTVLSWHTRTCEPGTFVKLPYLSSVVPIAMLSNVSRRVAARALCRQVHRWLVPMPVGA